MLPQNKLKKNLNLYLNKKYEMFEGCVQMSFFAQIHYFSEKQNERNTELLQVKPISAE